MGYCFWIYHLKLNCLRTFRLQFWSEVGISIISPFPWCLCEWPAKLVRYSSHSHVAWFIVHFKTSYSVQFIFGNYNFQPLYLPIQTYSTDTTSHSFFIQVCIGKDGNEKLSFLKPAFANKNFDAINWRIGLHHTLIREKNLFLFQQSVCAYHIVYLYQTNCTKSVNYNRDAGSQYWRLSLNLLIAPSLVSHSYMKSLKCNGHAKVPW